MEPGIVTEEETTQNFCTYWLKKIIQTEQQLPSVFQVTFELILLIPLLSTNVENSKEVENALFVATVMAETVDVSNNLNLQ
jgi:hypothetical protein